MNPLVVLMMESIARNQTIDGVLYLDPLDETQRSSRMMIGGRLNSTSDDVIHYHQTSDLALSNMDGQSSSSTLSPTVVTALIMDWQSMMVAAALSVIVLLTIGGNLLILAAVLFNSNLRGPTHILIANLAVADLLLGFLVLPFSATLEVYLFHLEIVVH